MPKADPYNAETCARYATIYNIKHNNLYWQVQDIVNDTYYLFGAYYDGRPKIGPSVRIIGIRQAAWLNMTTNLYCQLWFPGHKRTIIAKVHYIQYLWREKWNFEDHPLKPYMLSCMIPPEYHGWVPDSVSLVENPCDNATNNLRVVNNQPRGEKREFFVCVKSLNFRNNPGVAVRMVEWLELLKILGAEKVVFHALQLNPRLEQVLNYYKRTWNVEVIPTSLPGTLPNVPDFMINFLSAKFVHKIFHELIDYNDCFYKNFNLFHFVVLLDIDEVLVPVGSLQTWHELMYNVLLPRAKKMPHVSHTFAARNAFVMDDAKEYGDWTAGVPRYMHMLQNVHRMANYTEYGARIKAFHLTEKTLALHNHYTRTCVGERGEILEWCNTFDITVDVGYLLHYCVRRSKSECSVKRGENLTIDNTLFKYKTELVAATKKAMLKIGFL
ncbi:uncharacterized protein LOC135946283 [Cloeon dipterum]|uniref:uncharacterized protein LOC135946283 n=1 Tax=Cloeon dipterum TaxID=197152 RepID=UPI0032209D51